MDPVGATHSVPTETATVYALDISKPQVDFIAEREGVMSIFQAATVVG